MRDRTRVSKRRSISAKYSRRQWRASGSAGSAGVISTRAAVSSRSTCPWRRRGAPAGRRQGSSSDHAGRRPVVDLRSLGGAGLGEPGRAHPPVVGAGFHRDEPVGFERPQQPAEVARVESEAVRSRRTSQPSPARPISHSSRDSPSDRSRARKWSSSAPTRWVTRRLKRRTWSTIVSSISLTIVREVVTTVGIYRSERRRSCLTASSAPGAGWAGRGRPRRPRARPPRCPRAACGSRRGRCRRRRARRRP